MYRSHNCGELTAKNIDKKSKLAGWAHSRRDHGGVIFIDLRDRYGITQIVFDPAHNKQVHAMAEHIGREFVLSVSGKIRLRPKHMENPKIPTGEIEMLVDAVDVLSESETPPIEIDERIEASEEIRLQYRYLDLRRPNMIRQMKLRHDAAQAARQYFNSQGFLEIETPILIRSTPEGARDYIVPSRVNPGKFYALPQSPQLYKQILMVSGMDRYYQLARCLRDEDLRADRQPEHTQMDFEMSFVHQDDVLHFVEGLYKHLFKAVLNVNLKTPFQRFTYKEAMNRFGTDKPDTRFGLELIDVTEAVKESDFQVFSKAEQVKCLVAQHAFGRNEIDELIKWAQENGAKGLAWMRATEKGLESSIVKFFSPAVQKKILLTTKAKKGSTIFYIADSSKMVAEILGKLRSELGKRLKLTDKKKFNFCWVTDFPLFEWNEDDEAWNATHHLFTMPKKDHINLLEKDAANAPPFHLLK